MSVEPKQEHELDKSTGNVTKRYITLIEEVLLLAAQYSYHFNQHLQSDGVFAQQLLIALLLDIVNLVHGHINHFRGTTAQIKQEEHISPNNNTNSNVNPPTITDQAKKQDDLSSSFANILKSYQSLLIQKNILEKDQESASKSSLLDSQLNVNSSAKTTISVPLLDLDDIKDGKTDEQMHQTTKNTSTTTPLISNLSSDSAPLSSVPKELLPVITISSPLASPTASRKPSAQPSSHPAPPPPHYPMYAPYYNPYVYQPFYYNPYMPPYGVLHPTVPDTQTLPAPQASTPPAQQNPPPQPQPQTAQSPAVQNTTQSTPPSSPLHNSSPAAPPSTKESPRPSSPRSSSPTPSSQTSTSPRSRSSSVPAQTSPRQRLPNSPRSHLAPTDPTWTTASINHVPPHSPIARIPSPNSSFAKPAALIRAPTMTDFQELPPNARSAPTSKRTSPTPSELAKGLPKPNENGNTAEEEEQFGLIHSSPASFFRNLQKQQTAPPGRAIVIPKSSANPSTTGPIRNRPTPPPSKLGSANPSPQPSPGQSPEVARKGIPKMTRKPVNKMLQKVSHSSEQSEEDAEDPDNKGVKKTEDFIERHQSVFDFFLTDKKEESAGWWLNDMPDDVEVWEYDGQGNSIRGPQKKLYPTESIMDFFQKYESEIPRSSTPSPRGQP